MEEAPRVSVKSYRDLQVWQKAMDLVVICYKLTDRLPDRERYGLVSQIQRSAVSVPANIAEGHGRHHLGDKLHHLSISNGSLKELETHLLVTVRLAYLKQSELALALELADELGKMLTVLVRRLREKAK
jgi:four helix bundle protein